MLKPQAYYKKVVLELIRNSDSTEKTINHLLNAMGVKASQLGFEYIKQSLLILVKEDHFYNINVVKELYPKVRDKCKAKTDSRVERAIRHSIEYLFIDNNLTEEQKGICSFIFNNQGEIKKMSNSDFLFIVTRFLKEYIKNKV